MHYLDQQRLDLVLDGVDLVLHRRSVVGGDRSGNHWSGNTTGSAQSGLGWHENVWNVLVLTQQGEMQQDLDWLGVGSHDDEFRNTSVQGLGSFIGSFFQLTQILRLLNDVQYLLGQGGVCQWEGFWVRCGHC